MNEPTYWHPEDKAWLAERKREWRYVKYNLGVYVRFSDLKREYFKFHEELFFHGTVNPEIREVDLADRDYPLIHGDQPFLYALPLFRLWYHPAPESLDLDALRREYVYRGQQAPRANWAPVARVFLGMCGGGGAPYPVDYGPMGGRETLALKLCLPSMDYRDTYIVGQRTEYAYCLPPDEILGSCMYSTRHELRKDARWYPNAAGQWLWDHLSYAMGKYPDGFGIRYPDWHHSLKRVMAEILGFEQRTDLSRRRPTTIAMVERLLRQYERREFSDAMLKLWDEANADQRALREENASTPWYLASEAYIQDEYRLTTEKQRERIAQWKLI